eukprot:GHVU01100395.1.p1 GENE.GHVU01100395.1~~GHVU01100395.1.p1  ORF type:complete len:196 (-),score=37.29 GHVU01100395.1:520-1107(-)
MSDEEFDGLLRTYRPHMSHSYNFADYRKLQKERRTLAAALENSELRARVADHEATQPFGRAWTAVAGDVPLLAYFAAGLATPAASTAGVERDQGRQKLLLGNMRTSMKESTLDGLLHANQLQLLEDLAADVAVPVRCTYEPAEADFDVETEDDLDDQEEALMQELDSSDEEEENEKGASSSDYDGYAESGNDDDD